MADRERVLALLERHGWNATSFQILEPGFQYWFDDDACVGYVDTGRAWVAAGPPIAAAERLAETSARFVDAAREAGRRACLFGTEARFRDATTWPSLPIGEQPIWSPAAWDGIVRGKKSLREQLRRARAKGVVVRALPVEELTARRAELAGNIVGFLGIVPIYARDGWFFEDFLRDPAAPNGTIELLIDAGMRAAATENVAIATLGLAPLAGEINPVLRSARRVGRVLYDFEGLRAFKAKLAPSSWDPIFLSYPPGGSSIRAVVDTLTAFARGGLLRFGIETLLRGPAIVIRLLAALLVVWTCLLALPSSAAWFPSPVWQYGWVAFDVVLGAALFVLAARWRQPLADIVAVAVTADAAVTLGEALVFNAPRIGGAVDALVVTTAVAAPAFAAVLLWNARVHRGAT